MSILPNASDKAAAELTKLQAARILLEEQLASDEARLQEWRAQAAELELAALLDEGEAPARPDVGALEATIAAKKAARPKLLSKLREAIRGVAHVKAEALRRETARKQKTLDVYAAERQKLLAALEAFTGARWLVDQSREGPTLLGGAVSIRTGEPAPVDKGVLLSAEVADLMQRAADIESEAARACEGGAVSGSTLEELLTAVSVHPLGPLPSAVRAWFSETEGREAAQWQNQFPDGIFRAGGGGAHTVATPATRQTAFTLTWNRDGVIDRSRSGGVSSLAPLMDGGKPRPAVPLSMYVSRAS
jgi:hypothetical protein